MVDIVGSGTTTTAPQLRWSILLTRFYPRKEGTSKCFEHRVKYESTRMNPIPVVREIASAEQGIAEMLHGAMLGLKMLKRPLDLHLVVYEDKETKLLAERELMPVAQRLGATVTLHTADDRLPERIESPVKVYRSSPGNPISTAFRLAKEMQGVVISPGNTGLVMACALFELGRIPGISRPPIATPWPTKRKSMFILDSGANVDVRPVHL